MKNQLAWDTCRCVGGRCGTRDTCARFMDSPAGPRTPYADLSFEIVDGNCINFIQHEPPK